MSPLIKRWDAKYIRPAEPAPPGGGTAGVRAANLRRSRLAADRAVAEALQILTRDDVPDRHRMMLQARIDRPHDTLREIGEHLGMTQDQYASALRRAFEWAARR